MMIDAAWAAIAGVGLYVALGDFRATGVAVGLGLGIVAQDPSLLLAGLMGGLAYAHYDRAAVRARRRDQDEQEALLFLVRLGQLLAVRGTLAGALDDMGYRSPWAGTDAGERVLVAVATQYRVGALEFLARVAVLVRRHGGSLVPVVDWARDIIQRAQSRRHARQLEEAAQRSTIVVLALAPWGVLAVFRLMVPAFYRILVTSPIGDIAVLLVGGVTLAVFLVLTAHMQREAQIR